MTHLCQENESESERTPFVDKGSDVHPSSENKEPFKPGNVAKGIISAFIWAMVRPTSRICVQGLENRYISILYFDL